MTTPPFPGQAGKQEAISFQQQAVVRSSAQFFQPFSRENGELLAIVHLPQASLQSFKKPLVSPQPGHPRKAQHFHRIPKPLDRHTQPMQTLPVVLTSHGPPAFHHLANPLIQNFPGHLNRGTKPNASHPLAGRAHGLSDSGQNLSQPQFPECFAGFDFPLLLSSIQPSGQIPQSQFFSNRTAFFQGFNQIIPGNSLIICLAQAPRSRPGFRIKTVKITAWKPRF